MYTQRDTSAPPTCVSSIGTARRPFLPLRMLVGALPLARLATASGRHGRRACAS